MPSIVSPVCTSSGQRQLEMSISQLHGVEMPIGAMLIHHSTATECPSLLHPHSCSLATEGHAPSAGNGQDAEAASVHDGRSVQQAPLDGRHGDGLAVHAQLWLADLLLVAEVQAQHGQALHELAGDVVRGELRGSRCSIVPLTQPLNRFGVAFAIGRGTGKSSGVLTRQSSSYNTDATPKSSSMHAVQIKRSADRCLFRNVLGDVPTGTAGGRAALYDAERSECPMMAP